MKTLAIVLWWTAVVGGIAVVLVVVSEALRGILGPFGRLSGLGAWLRWRKQRPNPHKYPDGYYYVMAFEQDLMDWRRRNPRAR